MAIDSNRFVPGFVVTALLSFLVFCQAKEYIVGNGKGWTLGVNYEKWAANKKFRVGDTLVFNYHVGFHNVVRVNGTAFADCVKRPNLGVHVSGNDRIALSHTGNMWFICGVNNHCENGMKLKIRVRKPRSHLHAPAYTSTATPVPAPAPAPAPASADTSTATPVPAPAHTSTSPPVSAPAHASSTTADPSHATVGIFHKRLSSFPWN